MTIVPTTERNRALQRDIAHSRRLFSLIRNSDYTSAESIFYLANLADGAMKTRALLGHALLTCRDYGARPDDNRLAV